MRKVKKTKKIDKKTSRRPRQKTSRLDKFIALLRKIIAIPVVMASLILACLAAWFYFSGNYGLTVNKIHEVRDKASVEAGLTLKDILLEGQEHTPQAAILSAITKAGKDGGVLNVGEPVVNINLWKIKNRLEELNWVKSAAVERQFPSTLSVSITERVPIALWQDDGKVKLIDEEGKIIDDANLENFTNLIIMVGKDAPSHIEALLGMIRSEPEIADRVSSVIRISERRWNIRLRNDIEIKLPEEAPQKAWKYLAQIQKDSQILDSNVKNIDLRVAEKMFVK
jgi:cell division protein FtsQ